MVYQDLSTQRKSISRGDGLIGPDFDSELVKVGLVAYTGVFHSVVDLQNGGVDGVYGNGTDGHGSSLVLSCNHVAAAVTDGQFHGQGCACAQSSNVQIGVEDFNLCVCLNIACGNFTFACCFNIHGLGTCAVQLSDDALYVQNDFSYIFLNTGNGAEFVLYAGNLNAGNSGAGQRREQYSSQRVTQSGTVTTFQGFNDVLTVRIISGCFETYDTRLLDFDHYLITLLKNFVYHKRYGGVQLTNCEGQKITWSTIRRSGVQQPRSRYRL